MSVDTAVIVCEHGVPLVGGVKALFGCPYCRMDAAIPREGRRSGVDQFMETFMLRVAREADE